MFSELSDRVARLESAQQNMTLDTLEESVDRLSRRALPPGAFGTRMPKDMLRTW